MRLFGDYKKYDGVYSISPTLLWEYDLSSFDWWKARRLVVTRVIERGRKEDFYAMFNLYGGWEGVREIVKEIPHLDPIDMNFVCVYFELKKEELRCYTNKLLRDKLLNYLKKYKPSLCCSRLP